jgi:hypothetical protein
MHINLLASPTKGAQPFATSPATIEKDGNNIYLSFAQTAGVVSTDSAIALAEAILETAGFTSEPVEANIPSGWSLTAQDGGYVITDASGVVRGNFRPVSKYVSA